MKEVHSDISRLLSLCWQPLTGFVPTGQMLRPGHLIWKEKSEKQEKGRRKGTRGEKTTEDESDRTQWCPDQKNIGRMTVVCLFTLVLAFCFLSFTLPLYHTDTHTHTHTRKHTSGLTLA